MLTIFPVHVQQTFTSQCGAEAQIHEPHSSGSGILRPVFNADEVVDSGCALCPVFLLRQTSELFIKQLFVTSTLLNSIDRYQWGEL